MTALLLFLIFFKISLFSIGGGYNMVPMMQHELDAHGWLTPNEFLDLFALSEATPGPVAVNAATLAGAKIAGPLGALAATAGACLPGFLLALLAGAWLLRHRDHPDIAAILRILPPLLAGLILATTYRLFSALDLAPAAKPALQLAILAAVLPRRPLPPQDLPPRPTRRRRPRRSRHPLGLTPKKPSPAPSAALASTIRPQAAPHPAAGRPQVGPYRIRLSSRLIRLPLRVRKIVESPSPSKPLSVGPGLRAGRIRQGLRPRKDVEWASNVPPPFGMGRLRPPLQPSHTALTGCPLTSCNFHNRPSARERFDGAAPQEYDAARPKLERS